MKTIRALAVLLALSGVAHAQVSPPLRIADATHTLPYEPTLKLLGSGATLVCADSSGTKSTNCTTTASNLITSVSTGLHLSAGVLTVDQAFSPTWTGSHSFTQQVTLNGTGNQIGAAKTTLDFGNGGYGTQTITLGAAGGNDFVAYLNAAQTFAGKSISGSANILTNIGNAALTNSSITVTTANGLGGATTVSLGGTLALTCATCVLTSGSYADPAWITSLAGSKISGAVANATTAVNFSGSLVGVVSGSQGATTIANGNVTNAMLANSSFTLTVPSWLSAGSVSLGGSLAISGVSQAQNLVLASPNGSSGVLAPRALVAADIPSLSATYCALTGCTMSGAITLSGTQLGVYSLGGTPTISAAAVAFAANSVWTGANSLTNTIALTTTTNVADGATSVANQYANTTDITSGGLLGQWTSGLQKAFAIQRLSAGTWLWGPGSANALGTLSGLRLSDGSGTILKYSTQSVEVNTDVVGTSFHISGADVIDIIAGKLETHTDLGMALGDATHRFSVARVESYYGVQQNVTGSGAVTITPSSGEVYELTSNGNVSSIAISTGAFDGQVLKFVLVQNAGGTNTWPTTFTNATIAGGAFTKTLTASAVDEITFVYDSAATKWREVSRSLNQS